ncbi:MAG: hypothetical protein A2297_07730 [Elusimicrobia bacterium RIFOXYB2_FULL_48_7]|nr:MAG: hypothetical protein A2297_07730 [Elusimicrobia bacterium RIFOXYB2_FULL_48_7]
MLSFKTKFIVSYVVTGLIVFLATSRLGLNYFVQAALAVVVSGVIGFFTTYRISHSFDRFQKLMGKISSGYLKLNVDIRSAQVIQDISESLDRILTGFSSLIDISRKLTKETSLDKLLNLIIEQSASLMDAERATLYLFNNDTQELWSYIAQDLEIKEIRVPLGKGIAGYVAKTGKMLNVRDAYKDERFDIMSDKIDKITGFKTRDVLCAPMFDHRGGILGVLQVLNKKNGHFREYDESLLGALAAQAGVAIENAKLYESQESLFMGFIKTMASIIDARDPVTRGHSERVAKYSVAIGKAMDFSEKDLKVLEYAAILHDVGKISIPDAVLQKPGEFTKEEYEIVKRHTVYTKEILTNIYSSSDLREMPLMAASHHEKLDGSGYPAGLTSDSIPIQSRIIAVADVYDAIVSYDRPYKPAMSPEKAIAILRQDSEKGKYDKEVVRVFVEKQLYRIERREYVRISAELSFEYTAISHDEKKLEEFKQAQTKNISAAGILFETKDNLQPGSYLQIRLNFQQYSFDILGRVARRIESPDGKTEVGIVFLNLNPELKKHISSYLTDFENPKVKH